MSGITIGHYEIISTLGRGSIGVVYKARDNRLGRIVAVKALKSIFINNDSPDNLELKRFYQESKAAGMLRHPNIVTIFDVGCTELGSPYIVMDYIEGRTLSEIIDSHGPLSTNEILSYLYPIASAIDYAHSKGILHRDITPNNIIIDKEDQPFLLDFSLAKMLHQSITPTGMMLGSPGYMAPELIDGGKPTNASDIFSLGVLAYELFTGQTPFEGDDLVRVIFSVMNEPPRSFSDVGADLPKKLENVIAKAVSKRAGDRYDSAQDLVVAIEKAFVEENAKSVIKKIKDKESGRDSAGQWGDFKDNTSEQFDFHSDADQQDVDSPRKSISKSIARTVWRVVTVLSVLITVLLGTNIIFPATFSKGELLLINIGNAISDRKMVETFRSEETAQTLDPSRFNLASDKKLKALLKRGTSVNGDKDLNILRAAINAAGERSDKEFTEILIKLSSHPDELVRIDSLRALSRLPHSSREGVTKAFLARLSDRDYLVRGFSIKSLSEFGDKQVLEALSQQKELEQNELVRGILEEATRKLKDKIK